MSEEAKEAIRLCTNVIENADYMEYEYMKEYKKSSIDILVKEIERQHYIIKEVREELKNYRDMFIERHSAVDWRDFDFDKLIEILDKENKEW